jgi:hypothetical protein
VDGSVRDDARIDAVVNADRAALVRQLVDVPLAAALGSTQQVATDDAQRTGAGPRVARELAPTDGATASEHCRADVIAEVFVNVNKQLIISPPLKYQPEITPSTASKTITLKIKDTLAPNTTYSFNFGESIQDNNEGNPLRQFQFLCSTGSYIDSLSIKGTIADAHDKKTDHFV